MGICKEHTSLEACILSVRNYLSPRYGSDEVCYFVQEGVEVTTLPNKSVIQKSLYERVTSEDESIDGILRNYRIFR
jgi:hypothetical protein